MRKLTTDEVLLQESQMGGFSRVVGFCGNHALGDFVLQVLFCGSVKRLLGADELTLLYINDRPYKKFIALMLEEAFGKIGFPEGGIIPLNWFETSSTPSNQCPTPSWYEELIHCPGLLLLPSMIYDPRHLPDLTRLKFPEELTEESRETLVRMGVDPDRWFTCLHIRDSSYKFRGDAMSIRDLPPNTFADSIHAIREAGGQVVRIGHAGSGEMEPMEGLIDLTRSPETTFELQTYALSRARFNLMSESGPTLLSSALGTPTLTVNAASVGTWHAHDRLLSMALKRKDGVVMRTREIIDTIGLHVHEYHNKHPLDGFEQNTAEEILDATVGMLNEDHGATGWRADWPIPVPKKMDEPRWPIPIMPQKCRPALPDR